MGKEYLENEKALCTSAILLCHLCPGLHAIAETTKITSLRYLEYNKNERIRSDSSQLFLRKQGFIVPGIRSKLLIRPQS